MQHEAANSAIVVVADDRPTVVNVPGLAERPYAWQWYGGCGPRVPTYCLLVRTSLVAWRESVPHHSAGLVDPPGEARAAKSIQPYRLCRTGCPAGGAAEEV